MRYLFSSNISLILYISIVVYVLLNIIGHNCYATYQYNATIIGNYTDYLTDYDSLIVDVSVKVNNPGAYSLYGSLYDTNSTEIAWSIDHEDLSVGYHIMRLNFDIKAIKVISQKELHLGNLMLTSGSSDVGLTLCDSRPRLYYPISCNIANSVKFEPTNKYLTGVGYGELLLKFTIRDTAPVLFGRYDYNLINISILPMFTSFNVTTSDKGYAYILPGIYIPNKPNNFTITSCGVKNLNIGIKKNQGSYETFRSIWNNNRSRIWITSQVHADPMGTATAKSDLLSPGIYNVKFFGDASENVTQVDLVMTMTKKVVVNGSFNIGINTGGIPNGSYSIAFQSSNRSFSLYELSVKDV